MNYGYLLTVLVSVYITAILSDDENPCKTSNSCSCELKNGSGVVDLSQDGYTNATPSFRSLESVYVSEWRFSFNPCYPFTYNNSRYLDLGVPCKDVAACGYTKNKLNISEHFEGFKVRTAFGQQASAQFYLTKDFQLAIHYSTSISQGKLLQTNNLIVLLKCLSDKDDETTVEVISLDDNGLTLLLSSKCACPGKCGGSSKPDNPKSGLSTGSILLILFFTLFLVYFLGGIIINAVIRGAAGKEVIPQYYFWSSLPGLITDGATFVFCSCCNSKPTSARTYDNIS